MERLAHLIKEEVNLHLESKKEVENLTGKLKKIHEVLNDAERIGVTDSQVKNRLKELEDVSYEMEDALDEWKTVKHQLQNEGSEEVSDLWEKVISFIPSICSCFEHVHWRREINLKIKDLFGKLDLIVQGKDEFRFLPSGGNNSHKLDQIESTSFNTARLYGRSTEKEKLIQKLLSAGGSGVKIVLIVGTAGVGKTALAQFAFNDSKVVEHFELRRWIFFFSNHFDEKKIAKLVLQAFGLWGKFLDFSNLEMFLQHVKNFISKKRFLIVRDDVWNENRRKWEPLKNSLQGASGSRILVTTRSVRVVNVMCTDTRLPLGQLSNEECSSLLSSITFDGRSKEECEKLDDVGRKIALKCKRLSLAATFMGNLLCSKDTVGEWLNVLKIPLWQLKEARDKLFSYFYLNYNDLPLDLSSAFRVVSSIQKIP